MSESTRPSGLLPSDTEKSLKSFLKENDKLLPALSLFTALTVFSSTIVSGVFAYILSFLFLATTGVLYLELRVQFPEELRLDWRLTSLQLRYSLLMELPPNRLTLFALLLDLSLIALFAYSIVEYLYIWTAIALISLLVGLALVTTTLARRFLSTLPKLKAALDVLAETHPFLRALVSAIPNFLLAGALFTGNYIVEHSSLSSGFVQAFQVTTFIALATLVASTILSWRTIPETITELIQLEREARRLRKEIWIQDRHLALLAIEERELRHKNKLLDIEIMELKEITAKLEEAKSSPPESAESVWRDYERMRDYYLDRHPEARKHVEQSSVASQ